MFRFFILGIYHYIPHYVYSGGICMSVSRKLNLSFLMIVVLLIASLGFNLFQFKQIEKQVEETVYFRVAQVLIAESIIKDIYAQGLYLRDYILEPTAESKAY